jgi:hypothetical protein
MSTALDLDLAALMGELPDVPCESLGHNSGRHPENHSGPAAYYARVICVGCGMNTIKAYCEAFAVWVSSPNPAHYVECECGQVDPASEVITVLGPVNGRAS